MTHPVESCRLTEVDQITNGLNFSLTLMHFMTRENSTLIKSSTLRPRLHGIGSKWDRIHLDPIHFLRGVYTGSDPELLAFTRYRIHLNFMNS